ncbi:hypothetical protein [Glycomyces buryatensis]|uniref:Uncharacterized protein n=1 Tax=Glycomyces buryatensis TaxID=2570927 RepID=A0A4S8QKB1_9ACTN|nr:hypothetical protein [Glycomyces buryatensis]THV41184.1 hypothetical protein FAB82_13120 [Glycomyces buryatensis]
MIKWAGRIIVFLGLAHMLISLSMTLPTYADSWLGGDLWMPEGGLIGAEPTVAAFWFSIGSFGMPLIVVGATVLWMDRRGIVPPVFIAWTLGGWSLVSAALMEPAPWPLVWIAVGLLLAGARKGERPKEIAPTLQESGA